MNFANNLRFLRKQKGMSQDALASLLGYKSFTTIQKWETGAAEPSFKVTKQIAEIFRVTIHDLVESDMESNENIQESIKTDEDIAKEYIFGTTDVPDSMLEDVRKYARFLMQR